jgi:hypothetical protein
MLVWLLVADTLRTRPSKLSRPDMTLLVAELVVLFDRRRGLLYPPGRSGPADGTSGNAVGMWIMGACSMS